MGFFSNMYTKEGPGVPKNAPQKKGIARFFEILFRDFGMLWKAGLLSSLCLVPALIALIFTVLSFPYIILVAVGIILFLLASMLVGPAMVSLHAVVITTVRDIPCYMMHEYKKAWKNNYKQSVPFGMLISALYAIQIYTGYLILTTSNESSLFMLAVVLFSLILITMVSFMTLVQIIFIDLPLYKMIKNSLLLSFGYLKRSLPATIIFLVLSAAMALFYIFWPFYLLLGIIPIITLIVDMWLWPVFEKVFNITQLQEERKNQELEKEESFYLNKEN